MLDVVDADEEIGHITFVGKATNQRRQKQKAEGK